jgi:hypothetical protein
MSLEDLPRDILHHLVKICHIKGLDLINFSNTSVAIRNKCNDQLFANLLNLSKIEDAREEYVDFCANPLIWMLEHYPDYSWDWQLLSQNPNMTFQYLEDNPDKPWNWSALSRNPNITWQIVQDNPDKPWNWGGLSRNPSITWQIVFDNLGKPWYWRSLSSK